MLFCLRRGIKSTVRIASSYQTLPIRLLAPRLHTVPREPALVPSSNPSNPRNIASYAGLRNGNIRKQSEDIDPITTPIPSSRKDPEAWRALLEPFLPIELRQSTENGEHTGPPEKSFSSTEKVVPELLRQAREQKGLDILAYLGINHGRWAAVHWLAKDLLHKAAATDRVDTSAMSTSIFAMARESFDDITRSELSIEQCNYLAQSHSGAPSLSLDDLSDVTGGESRYSTQMMAAHLRDDTMGEIWQSLGCMVIKATDLPLDEAKMIMSHVFRILAHIHHINLVPPSVYAHYFPPDPSAPYRPPIIHLLSSRILTTISDAVWKAHEAEVAAATGVKPIDLTRSIPKLRHKLKVRELGLEVWTEFILWCCVDGGFLKEGAWILKQIKASKNWDKWKMIDWQTVEKSSLNSNSPRVDFQRLQDRAHMVFSETEGYSFDRPFVEMGDRTISGEVVVALVDGLVNTVRTGAGERGSKLGSVLEHISILKSMLETKDMHIKPGFWDCVVVRLLESSGVDPAVDPSSFDRIISFMPVVDGFASRENQSDEVLHPSFDGFSSNPAARLGLLYYLLHIYSLQGNVRKALSTFEKCHLGLLRFLTALNRDLFLGRYDKDLDDRDYLTFKPNSYKVTSETPVCLPVSLVPSFVNLLSSAKVHEFGRWLLYSDDFEGGPFIPPSYYSIPSLVPSLLHFATSSSNCDLFESVTNNLISPVSKEALRGILQFDVAHNHWPSVENLLEFLKNQMRVGWGVGDAMAVAAKILRLEKAIHDREMNPSNGKNSDLSRHLSEASSVLTRILEGHFTTPLELHLRVNLRPEDMINQLSRIFASIPGRLATIANKTHPDPPLEKLPFNHLPPNAFNVLLIALVETRGPLEGKRLWEMWCYSPRYLEADRIQEGGIVQLKTSAETSTLPDRPISSDRAKGREESSEKLVAPNLNVFRTLVRAAVNERRKEASEDLDAMMDWVVEMLGKWGITNMKEVDRELDGYLTERRKSTRENAAANRHKRMLEKLKEEPDGS
jgi:hypothetical protein